MRGFTIIALVVCTVTVNAHVYNLKDVGGIEGDSTLAAANTNADLMTSTMKMMQSGDILVVPEGNYHMNGGITASDKHGLTLQIDGTIHALASQKHWPRISTAKNKARVRDFMSFDNMAHFTITSSNNVTGVRGETAGSNGRGMIDGHGATWWGFPGIGYLQIGENRPKLLVVSHSSNVIVENIFFKDSPYWSTRFIVDGLEIRNSRVEAHRYSLDKHTVDDLTAFNTDGFDFSGNNIHVHHCTVWNQDDSFCVKDETTNVVVEHVDSSGLGLTIGSIQSHVRNITFRDVYMRKTVKGIYMKFRGAGVIEDVLYENIVMDEPEQFAIWIGPAQQEETKTCSLLWPTDIFAKCKTPSGAIYRNITFRNVVVNNPQRSAGVIIGSETNPIEGLTFDNVVVNYSDNEKLGSPWGRGYYCKNVKDGSVSKTSSPKPGCF